MLGPGGKISRGVAEATAGLGANAANATARAAWTPIRVGVSGDGQHGFSYGYMTMTRPDGTVVPGKYVAYWVRGAEGWRIAVYKRVPRSAGTVSTEMRPPSLPARIVAAPAAGADEVARWSRELADTEAAFAREGRDGLGKAFAKYGAPDAANVGGQGSPEFVFGNEAIGRAVSGGKDEPVDITWSADHTIVASSGDLGVNAGFITFGKNPPVPFLTIWRRSGPGQPWRYVAE